MQLNPFEKQVSRGAAWLDQNRPGWEFKIDLAELDLGQAHVCILGQIDGNFWSSLSGIVEADSDVEWAADHGFFVLADEEQGNTMPSLYNQLTDAWRTEIKHRFDTGQFSKAI